jgi:hypothetical protein
VLLGVSWWLSRGSAARSARRMWWFSLVLLLTGAAALSRLTGWPYPYLFLWRPALAVLVVFASGALVVSARGLLARRSLRLVLGALAVAVVCVFSGSMAVAVLAKDGPISPLEPVTRSLVGQVQDKVPAQGALLRLDTTSLLALQKGVFDGLVRRDRNVFVDESVAYQYGDQYGTSPSDVGKVWWVAESGYARTVLESQPGAEVIASYSPLSSADEARLRDLQRKLVDAFVADGHPEYVPLIDSPLLAFFVRDLSPPTRSLVDQVTRLNDRAAKAGGLRSSIVAFPPDQAPESLPYSEYVHLSG